MRTDVHFVVSKIVQINFIERQEEREKVKVEKWRMTSAKRNHYALVTESSVLVVNTLSSKF